MKCSVCGEEFTQKRSWQVNCSKKCKAKKSNLKRKDYIKEYNFKRKSHPVSRYNAQKQTAKRRGITFNISFEDWWSLWEDHWEHRGRGRDKLVMCRYGDSGAYEVGNVYIDTYSKNASFAACNQDQPRDSVNGRFINENN